MSIQTPKLIAIAMTFFAGITLLAFAACGGDDDNASATATGTSQSSGGSTKTPGGAAATTQAAEASTDVLSELQNLGKDIQQVTGKVTYTSTDTATDGTVTTSTFTYYSKEPNSRYDSVDSDGSTSAYITTPGTTYTCTSSDQSCIAQTGTGTGLGGLGLFGGFLSGDYIDALVSAAEAQGIDVSKSSENIAGTDATCFSGDDNGDVGKFCFSDDGLLLLSENASADGSSTSLKATSFTNDVSDSDFEPPYPVTTTISIPGQ